MFFLKLCMLNHVGKIQLIFRKSLLTTYKIEYPKTWNHMIFFQISIQFRVTFGQGINLLTFEYDDITLDDWLFLLWHYHKETSKQYYWCTSTLRMRSVFFFSFATQVLSAVTMVQSVFVECTQLLPSNIPNFVSLEGK